MAMPFRTIVLNVVRPGAIRLLAVAALVLVQACDGMVLPDYPGAQDVFDRDYVLARKIYQLSTDDFSAILAWYDNALQTVPHENKAAPQEADIPCAMKAWRQNGHDVSVTICNYPEHRTISTQVVYH